MIATREREIPLDYNLDDEKTKRAADLANQLLKQLYDDEYIIKKNKMPTVFVRIDRWTRELEPVSYNLEKMGKILLSDDSGIVLSNDDTKYLKHRDKTRVVLLSEYGFSSFIIEQ